MKKKRKKGLAADYKGATPEQVAQVVKVPVRHASKRTDRASEIKSRL